MRGCRDQRLARFPGGRCGADEPDDLIHIVERDAEAEQDVFTLASFAELVIGAAPNHIDAVLDEVLDGGDQAQLARLAVDDREIDDAEADLKLRVLVEVVENDVGLFAALQLEDDAHAVAIALVANLGDTFDFLVVDQRRGRLDEARLVDLVRDLGDDDLLAVLAHRHDGGFGADFEASPPRAEGVDNSLASEDETTGWKVGTFDDLHHLVELGFGMTDQEDGGVDDLVKVVGRNVGRHANGDAGR